MFKAKQLSADLYIYIFLSVLSEFDKSYRRLRTNFYFLYFSKQKCQGT